MINRAAVRAKVESLVKVRSESLEARGMTHPESLRISGEVVDGADRVARQAVEKYINDGFERGKFQRRGKTLFVRG